MRAGAHTPTYREAGLKTPLQGNATPIYEAGARTPHYGSSTPAHEGGRTPAHPAWDAAAHTPRPDHDLLLASASPPPAASSSHYDAAYQQGPFTPQTPGTMYGSDHTYSPYRPSPSPGTYAGYLATPSPAPYSPRSPYTAEDADDWHAPDLEVRVRGGAEPGLRGQAGALRSVSGATCAVYLPLEDRVLNLPAHLLEPVVPHSGDRVKVIAGEDREAVGQLISIENQEGVVKFGSDDIKIMQLRHLCKMASN